LERLDEDSRRRLETNPLRVLDSKDPSMQEVIAGAPRILDHLGNESRAHFDRFCTGLGDAGIDYEINPRLVRGLDYYNRTVFEWITDSLGAQGTVCAGGRYDALVAQLGGRPTPAVGFALGLERMVSMLEAGALPSERGLDAYLVAVGDGPQGKALLIAEALRDALPELQLLCHCGGGSFKSQFKKADRSGARYALVIGEAELERGVVGVKPLRREAEQTEVALEELAAFFATKAEPNSDDK
jgi:histidyl-tRNA synthetase